MPIKDRFWTKVDIRGPDDCWEWQASRRGIGYGVIGSNRQSPQQAHRVSWELTNGPIPAGQNVCHRCDNPPCVNPAHLFVGSQRDNVRDMIAKGRKNPKGAAGVANHNAKLTPEIAQDIRVRYAAGGVSQQQLADEYGVSQPAVGYVIRGKTWRM